MFLKLRKCFSCAASVETSHLEWSDSPSKWIQIHNNDNMETFQGIDGAHDHDSGFSPVRADLWLVLFPSSHGKQ